jgi:O-antigen ligase
MDNITLITGCIAVWLTVSLTWTDTKQSVFELFNLLSCLILFTAARTIPLVITASAIFAIATSFAAVEVSRIVIKRKLPAVDQTVSFGNGNHTGAFMLIGLFTGLWLTINLSAWFIPFVLLIVSVLIISKCKGAILGCIAGSIIMFLMLEFWQAAALISLMLVAVILKRFSSIPNARTSIGGRIWLHLAALEMIVKKPFTGWGLNSYRKELPDIIAEITKSKLHKYVGERLNSGMNTRSHRVHNDHLEIMAEIGLPGYVLFVYLFSSITYDPIIFGLLIAFLIHGLFFFPFREVHTAVPFWVIMGSMAGGTVGIVLIPLLVKILIACIIIAVIIQTLHKFLSQWYSELAKNKHITEQQKLEYIDIAVFHDPHDTGYLSDAAFFYSKVDPVKSFFYAARCLIHYDGSRMKQGIYDLFARTLIGATELKVCNYIEDKALWLEPDFQPAKTIKSYLEAKNAGGIK